MFGDMLCCVLLLVFAKIGCSFSDEDIPIIITLPNGEIQGHVLQSTNKNDYYAFQQIPYASPPVGDLQFKAPVPPENWDGILDATRNTKICYQFGPRSPLPNLTQTEDCLYLNVYTPQIPSDSSVSSLPVLFWIHGGAFYGWDGTFQTYGPQFFMDYNIVVVTINYRLGVLGFLTTDDGVIPGNLGIKDQIRALQWVQENIILFGGDPNQVTIAGESSGAISVGLHVISKKSKGLFRGGILQSGTSIVPSGVLASGRDTAFQLGRILSPGLTLENSTELLKLLQNTPVADIVDAGFTVRWYPVIEDQEIEGAIITGPMHEDIKNGNINQVPILIGFNSEETIALIRQEPLPPAAAMDKDIRTVVSRVFNVAEENLYTVGSKLKKLYTDGNFEDDIPAFIRFATDAGFTTPALRHADLQCAYTDVYVYQFSYEGELGQFVRSTDAEITGVSHGEDLRYMWADSENSDINTFPLPDILTHIRILRLWSNFVKYLNPTPTEDNLLERIIWPKVTTDSLFYLNINLTLEVKTDPRKYKEWKQIMDQYAVPPLISY